MKTNVHFLFYLTQVLEREMFQTEVVKKIKTHILCSMPFFFENRAIYNIMWKNTVDAGRPQINIWHMRIECWITKATNTHSQYVIFTDFLMQPWLHKGASKLRYTYIVCLVPLKSSNSFELY